MAKWQLQEAKQRLSRVVDLALTSGPQVITRHGLDAVVVVSADEYRRLAAPPVSFKAFLDSAPRLDELNVQRSDELPRDADL